MPDRDDVADERTSAARLDPADGPARTARLDAAEADLASVEVALERLDGDAYGTCERCGGDIGEQRLVELPTTRTCVTCAAH